MAEIQTAEAADGSIKVQSPQTDAEDSESNAPKPKGRRKSPITSKTDGPERNAQGVVVTQWDNPDADPNLRKHIGESPDGEGNEIEGH